MNAKWDFWIWIWILPLSLIPPPSVVYICLFINFGLIRMFVTLSYDVLDVLIKENVCIVWHLIIPWKYDISKCVYHNVNGLNVVQQSFSRIRIHLLTSCSQYTQFVFLWHKRNSSCNRHEFTMNSRQLQPAFHPHPYYLAENQCTQTHKKNSTSHHFIFASLILRFYFTVFMI